MRDDIEILCSRAEAERILKSLRKPPQSLVQRFFAFFQWWS